MFYSLLGNDITWKIRPKDIKGIKFTSDSVIIEEIKSKQFTFVSLN